MKYWQWEGVVMPRYYVKNNMGVWAESQLDLLYSPKLPYHKLPPKTSGPANRPSHTHLRVTMLRNTRSKTSQQCTATVEARQPLEKHPVNLPQNPYHSLILTCWENVTPTSATSHVNARSPLKAPAARFCSSPSRPCLVISIKWILCYSVGRPAPCIFFVTATGLMQLQGRFARNLLR